MTTYATLRSDLKDWSARSDISDSLANSMIAVVEDWIRRDVRVAEMVTSETLTLDAQTKALPTGFLEARSVTMDDSQNAALQFLPPERLRESRAFYESGPPTAYTIEGLNLVVAPAPTDSPDAYLVYYKAFDALSGDSDTNALMTRAYDLYLNAAVSLVFRYVQDFAAEDRWLSAYRESVDRVMREERRRKYSGSALVTTGVFAP